MKVAASAGCLCGRGSVVVRHQGSPARHALYDAVASCRSASLDPILYIIYVYVMVDHEQPGRRGGLGQRATVPPRHDGPATAVVTRQCGH